MTLKLNLHLKQCVSMNKTYTSYRAQRLIHGLNFTIYTMCHLSVQLWCAQKSTYVHKTEKKHNRSTGIFIIILCLACGTDILHACCTDTTSLHTCTVLIKTRPGKTWKTSIFPLDLPSSILWREKLMKTPNNTAPKANTATASFAILNVCKAYLPELQNNTSLCQCMAKPFHHLVFNYSAAILRSPLLQTERKLTWVHDMPNFSVNVHSSMCKITKHAERSARLYLPHLARNTQTHHSACAVFPVPEVIVQSTQFVKSRFPWMQTCSLWRRRVIFVVVEASDMNLILTDNNGDGKKEFRCRRQLCTAARLKATSIILQA